jgi:hypothetical protein
MMESLRITNLFPVIAALKDTTRIKMFWFLLFLLTVLASIESGLALMREILVQDEQATNAFLRGDETAAASSASFRWITTAAQMGLGFFLPFVLAVVAIPLETFFHTGRNVFGTATAAGMRGTAAFLRVIGSVVRHLGLMLVHLYDVLAVVGIAVGKLARKSGRSEGGTRRREPRPTLGKEVL